MASRIDAKIKQLEARGLVEVEILPAMAEDMRDFHRLMVTAPGPGDGRLVCGIYGLLPLRQNPGGRSRRVLPPVKSRCPEDGRSTKNIASLPRSISRVRQLEAQGMGGAALLEHMVGHVLDLQRLWSTTSDENARVFSAASTLACTATAC